MTICCGAGEQHGEEKPPHAHGPVIADVRLGEFLARDTAGSSNLFVNLRARDFISEGTSSSLA